MDDTSNSHSPQLQKMAETTHNSAGAVGNLPSAAGFRRRRWKTESENGGAEDDEKGEVEKKIAALQKIVPGGERLPAEELFEETAEYIVELQCQLKILRFLAAFLQGSDNNKKRKLVA